ncbi:MAG: hypothetical protein ACRCWS_09005 [Propionibacteriaceae bacterium]
MSWWTAFLASLGFGALAAVIPVFNNEIYIVTATVRSWAGIIPLALGLGIGNAAGKTAIFLAWRYGKQWLMTKKQSHQRPRHPWITALLSWVEHPVAGPAVVMLSCLCSVPPLYPTTLIAATSRMRWSWFALALVIGETLRMALIAAGTAGIVALF